MRIGVALIALCALLAACAGGGARPAQSSQPAAVSAALDSGPCPQAESVQSRWREMTWAEYYLDVESSAWRRGARVIWVEPPRVTRVARDQRVCTR
jgi:hypothetical protein